MLISVRFGCSYRIIDHIFRYDLRTEEWWLICAFGPQTVLNLGLCGSAGSAIRTGSGTFLYMLFGFERRACDTNQIIRFSLLDHRWERVKCVGDKERGQKTGHVQSKRPKEMKLDI